MERELVANTAVRVTGVYTHNLNSYVLSDISREGQYTIPITNRDPGPDGRLGTGDDTGQSFTYYEYPSSLAPASFSKTMFTNSEAADSTFKSFEVAFTKRPSQGMADRRVVLDHLAGHSDSVRRRGHRARQRDSVDLVSHPVRLEPQPGLQHGQ